MRNLAWKQIFVAAAVSFVLGTAFGRWQQTQQMRERWHHRESRVEWILKRMDSKIHFTADQRQKVEVILKNASPKMDAIHEEMMPKMEAVRQQVRTEILPLLTPDQQKKFDEMETEWQKRRQMRREGPPPPPPDDR